MFEFTEEFESMLESFSMDEYEEVFETVFTQQRQITDINSKYMYPANDYIKEAKKLKKAGKIKEAKAKYKKALDLYKRAVKEAEKIDDESTFMSIINALSPYSWGLMGGNEINRSLYGSKDTEHTSVRNITRLNAINQINARIKGLERAVNKL